MLLSFPILPQSINRFYQMDGQGRYLAPSKAGRDFIAYAKKQMLQQVREQGLQQELLTLDRQTPLRLRIDLHSPEWVTSEQELANRSLDNLLRAAVEALTATIKEYNPTYQDCSVVELICRKKQSDTTKTVLVLEKINAPV